MLPDKTYFKIGEAAAIVGVEPHTIRYWEKEFRAIRPAKTRSRQRLFRKKDLRLLLVIRHLLHNQRFTIDGARRKLKELNAAGMTVEATLDAIESGRPLDPEVQSEAEETDRVREELADARRTITGLEARVAELEAADAVALQAEVSKATATCDALRDTVEALRADLARARTRISALESENIELRAGGGVDGELREAMSERWSRLLDLAIAES